MFLLFFSIALIILNIVCFIKKKYLYLFIPCMLFLPEYYGIEINASLPILTVTRMMFIIFYIYAFINKRTDFHFFIPNIKTIKKQYWFLIAYFVLRIISNLRYIAIYGSASKTIFAIVFEQLLLLYAIYLLAPTKDEITTLIKIIVYSATVLFIIGVLESILFIRPFDSLYTVSRYMLNDHYIRLGLMRSTTTMGLPGFYGNMCILMLPAILYLLDCTHQRRYLIISVLDFLAIIHSGSRSNIFVAVGIYVVYFFLFIRNKDKLHSFIKHTLVVIASLLITITILSIGNVYLRYFYIGMGKSVLNEVGFSFDLNANAPEGLEGFGTNKEGTTSRVEQFAGIYYTAKINPVFGLGAGAQNRGDVQYYRKNGGWYTVKTYDLGIVEIFCNEGLLGFLGLCSLIGYAFLISKHNQYHKLIIIAYLLSTLSTANMYQFLITIVLVLNTLPPTREDCI